MYEAVYMAATGIRHQQMRLDTIANNVANINTVGYKATRLDFKDAIYTANSLGPVASTGENTQKGHGVIAAANNRLYEGGALLDTGRDLDFAIQGVGFLEIEDANGGIFYTQSGNLYLSGTDPDQDKYLVTGNGSYVHDAAGNRILCPAGTTAVGCSETGLITFSGPDGETGPLGTVQLGVFTFSNPHGLESAGKDSFRISEASGQRLEAREYSVRQGALEASNVSLAQEMTLMIRAQRAFSLASRALTTADDMEGIANNMKR